MYGSTFPATIHSYSKTSNPHPECRNRESPVSISIEHPNLSASIRKKTHIITQSAFPLTVPLHHQLYVQLPQPPTRNHGFAKRNNLRRLRAHKGRILLPQTEKEPHPIKGSQGRTEIKSRAKSQKPNPPPLKHPQPQNQKVFQSQSPNPAEIEGPGQSVVQSRTPGQIS